jgi:hypothetical protein
MTVFVICLLVLQFISSRNDIDSLVGDKTICRVILLNQCMWSCRKYLDPFYVYVFDNLKTGKQRMDSF